MNATSLAVFASMFFCSNVIAIDTSSNMKKVVRKHPIKRTRLNERHFVSHRPTFFTDEELTQNLINLEKASSTMEKLLGIRKILSKSRKCEYNQQNHEKFNNILQDVYKNCNQTNTKELNLLIGLFHYAQQSPLLNDSQKEDTKKQLDELIKKIKKSHSLNLKTTMQNLNNLDSKNDYKNKIQSIFQLVRKMKNIKGSPKELQSEFSAAIQDAYSNRPMNDTISLSKLRDVLTFASNSPLLSTIKQYEIKEIFIPTVLKNIEQSKQLASTGAANLNDQTAMNKIV